MKSVGSRLWVLALVFALLLAFVLWLFHAREPAYGGKPVTAWAMQWRTNFWSLQPSADTVRAWKEAQTALQALNSNAVPYLIDLMQTRESRSKERLRRIVPQAWHTRLKLESRAAKQWELGAHGIAGMGNKGGAAVPHLMVMATNAAITEDQRYLAVWTLYQLKSAAEPAIPLLIQCLDLPDNRSGRREDAVLALGSIHSRPEQTVPALVRFLETASQRNANGERWAAVEALGLFGSNAAPSVPTLLRLLQDPDSHIRETVTNCLPVIDPVAAQKAGVKRP